MFTTQVASRSKRSPRTTPRRSCGSTLIPSRASNRWIARRLVYGAGVMWTRRSTNNIASIIEKLYRCFVEKRRDAGGDQSVDRDATDGEVKALDSKFTVHGSALYRHADIAEFREAAAADPFEVFARRRASPTPKPTTPSASSATAPGTPDDDRRRWLVVAGGKPANFCDLGGGGSAEGAVDALRGS